MINCTVCGNYTGASGAAIKLSNCDSASIINTIIHYYGSQYGIHFLNSAQSQIAFCDIFYFDGSNFTGTTPPGLGQIITTNYNGDLCDVYYNIFLNPLFVSFPNPANLHLQFNSPCIDAGNPLTPFDPDNTIADIGAFYYHQGIGIISNPPADILPKVLLYPPYPNPFNSSATIIFEATSATYVSLTLSNILGAELILFKEGFLPAGAYKFYVEGDYLANGLYFIQLRTKEGVYRHKLVHIK
jgi:hypothetical protein